MLAQGKMSRDCQCLGKFYYITNRESNLGLKKIKSVSKTDLWQEYFCWKSICSSEIQKWVCYNDETFPYIKHQEIIRICYICFKYMSLERWVGKKWVKRKTWRNEGMK